MHICRRKAYLEFGTRIANLFSNVCQKRIATVLPGIIFSGADIPIKVQALASACGWPGVLVVGETWNWEACARALEDAEHWLTVHIAPPGYAFYTNACGQWGLWAIGKWH